MCAVERGWVGGGCIQSICQRSYVCAGHATIEGMGKNRGCGVGLALWLIAEIISHVVEKSLKKKF